MNFSPFSCPIFLGHPKARGRCSQGERVLYGRDLWCSGGTGKAEAAKCVVCIPIRDRGRRNLARAVPRKMRGKKRRALTELGSHGAGGQVGAYKVTGRVKVLRRRRQGM